MMAVFYGERPQVRPASHMDTHTWHQHPGTLCPGNKVWPRPCHAQCAAQSEAHDSQRERQRQRERGRQRVRVGAQPFHVKDPQNYLYLAAERTDISKYVVPGSPQNQIFELQTFTVTYLMICRFCTHFHNYSKIAAL